MSRRGGRRSDRAQKDAPVVATLSLWGEAGAPPDYDPGAVTAPLELGQMAELEGPPGGGGQREASATSERLQEQLDLQVTSSPELGAATPELAAPSPERAPGSAAVVTGSPDVAMGLDDELVAPGELRPAAAAVVSTPVARAPMTSLRG